MNLPFARKGRTFSKIGDDYEASERVEHFPKRISRAAGASSSRRLPLAAELLAASFASAQVRGFLVVLVLVIGSTYNSTLHVTGSLDAFIDFPVLFTSSIASPGGKRAVRGREAGRKKATDERNTRLYVPAQTAWSKA